MENKILKFLESNKVLFKYNKKFHPILTSGKHSNIYFNMLKLFENPSSFKIMVDFIFKNNKDLIKEIANSCNCIGGILTLGSHLSSILPELYPEFRTKQRIIYNKKESKKLSYWNEDEIKNSVLLVDDVITTGKSIQYIIENSKKTIFSKYIIVLINRSNSDYILINDKYYEIISALKIKSELYDENECPFCKTGSKPIKPKLEWKSCKK